MSMTIKKGDTVLVITGKEKGKTGKVLDVFPKDNKVLVDGVNIVTKHKKARKQNEKSEIVKQTAPIEASNVLVVCPTCGKATRVGHKEIDGKKVRVCKKCSASLDKEFVKATKKDAKKNISSAKVENAKTAKTTKKAEEKKTEEKNTSKTVKTTASKTKEAKTSTTKKSTKKPAAKTEA